MRVPHLVPVLLLSTLLLAVPAASWGKTIEELREEIQSRRQQLQQAEKRISEFKENIQLKRREARTLQEQIGLIEDNIGEVELTLSRTIVEIETTGVEIEGVVAEIEKREEEIQGQKSRLAEYIRTMHTLDQQSTVTIFLKYQTFSEAVNEVGTFAELQQRGQETLVAIQQLRDELASKRRELEDFKQTLDALRVRQEREQATLASQRASKSRILELTNAQEQQFQSLLKDSQATHQAAQADIKQLDTLLREELEKQGNGKLPSVGVMDWPIEAVFGVSCEYHCGGYPYEYLIGPHAGIDIPSNIGTPIKAPSDGYVARTHDSGGPGYSYIMLLHGDNVTTVYGHVSGFAVNEGQRVTRGTIIGYTGGAPGMRGAGLSSGPHLHFEVRVNNATVNPRKYL
jgi:murein DD-endopeptidase MepM/ murein hydrolase activator NlpD